MRPVIVPVDLRGCVGYQSPDGWVHPTIAAAVRHVQSRRPAAVARPVPTARVAAVVPAPAAAAALSDLTRELRQALAELAAAPSVPSLTWTAEHRWAVAERAKRTARVTRARRRLADHRRRTGTPAPSAWKPRPIRPAERRAEQRWLAVADRTPLGWAVAELHWPAARVVLPDGRRVAA